MRRTLTILLACLAVDVTARAHAQGTRYDNGAQHGPPDTVMPPRPAEVAATPPAPNAKGPSATGSASAISGAAAMPAKPQTPGALELDWDVWWHFHQQEFLDPRRHVHAGVIVPPQFAQDPLLAAQFARAPRPLPGEIEEEVEPVLAQLAEGASSELAAGALMGLARLGARADRTPSERARRILRAALASPVRGLAETAVIALAIQADASAFELLGALVRDGAEGRRLVALDAVPWRMRSLAAYGLGLLAHAARTNRERQVAARALTDALEAEPAPPLDTQVACLLSLGLCALDPDPLGATSAPWISRQTLLAFLERCAERPEAARLVRAHAWASRARLAATAQDQLRERAAQDAAALLATEGVDALVREACILGLGELVDFGRPADAAAIAQLFGLLQKGSGSDADAARLALLASAGRSAATHVPDPTLDRLRAALVEASSAPAARTRAWSALALGVLEARFARAGGQVRAASGQALRALWTRDASPDVRGATALALGLVRGDEACTLLADELLRTSDDAARGYCALGLGLAGCSERAPLVHAVLRASAEQPFTLESCAVALALVDDKSVLDDLCAGLDRALAVPRRGWFALALGEVGDARALPRITAGLRDERLTRRSRAYLAVALGMLCESEERPWAAPIREHLAWRATSETLFSGTGQGVLEFL